MARKSRCSPRTTRNIYLANAVVWTLMIPVNWDRLATYNEVLSMSVDLGITAGDVTFAKVMVLAAVALAVTWWVLWARFDKKHNETD